MSSSKALSWCHTIKITSVKFSVTLCPWYHQCGNSVLLLKSRMFKPTHRLTCHLPILNQKTRAPWKHNFHLPLRIFDRAGKGNGLNLKELQHGKTTELCDQLRMRWQWGLLTSLPFVTVSLQYSPQQATTSEGKGTYNRFLHWAPAFWEAWPSETKRLCPPLLT